MFLARGRTLFHFHNITIINHSSNKDTPKMAVVSSFVSAESNDKAPSKGEQVDVGEQAANMTTQGQTTHDDMSRFRATLLPPMDSTKELCDVSLQFIRQEPQVRSTEY